MGACATTLCQNGATCDGTWVATCTCIPGWTGPLCAQDIDECASTPCKNKGECTTPTFGNYTCTCLSVMRFGLRLVLSIWFNGALTWVWLDDELFRAGEATVELQICFRVSFKAFKQDIVSINCETGIFLSVGSDFLGGLRSARGISSSMHTAHTI